MDKLQSALGYISDVDRLPRLSFVCRKVIGSLRCFCWKRSTVTLAAACSFVCGNTRGREPSPGRAPHLFLVLLPEAKAGFISGLSPKQTLHVDGDICLRCTWRLCGFP